MSSEVPVVLVEGTLNSLGVARSLALGRMPIYLVSTTRFCAPSWSRYCSLVRIPSLEGRPFIDSLKDLGRRLGNRPVLILTSDVCVEAVSTFRDELAPLYRLNLPSAEMVKTLADKTMFQALAEQEQWAVPKSIALDSVADLGRLSRLKPPLILKPAIKSWVRDDLVDRAARAGTLAEAQSVATRMLKRAPRVIVQEWIDGPDTEIYFTLFTCDRLSQLCGIFSGRKLVCSPPHVGSTAICIAAPEVSAELHKIVTDLVARVKYRGLGSLEFKRDGRTGRFVMIEPTVGRTDWQEEIATLCGVNLPLIAYRTALGEYVKGKPATVPSTAWRSSLEYRAPPEVLPEGTHMIDGYFRWSDPLPGLYYYGFEYFTSRVLRRAAKLFSPKDADDL